MIQSNKWAICFFVLIFTREWWYTAVYPQISFIALQQAQKREKNWYKFFSSTGFQHSHMYPSFLF